MRNRLSGSRLRHSPDSRDVGRERGSGLVIAMAVLAMLSIIATTFIAIVRLDTRISNSYSEDVRCEMLAAGMLNYFKAVLRDDLDRTWGKYENRDTGVGYVSWVWGPRIDLDIPGFYIEDRKYKGVPAKTPHARPEYGIPVSNDFWFCAPWTTWGDFGKLYTSTHYLVTQQSFAWNDIHGAAHGMIGRYYSQTDKREYDIWLGRSNNFVDGVGRIVDKDHPDRAKRIDDDADGTANPAYIYGSYTPFWYENTADLHWYYDRPSLVMFTGNTYYFPGGRFTSEERLPGGVYWRWGVKLGVSHSAYANINVHGNMDAGDSSFLNNMGELGLGARVPLDERTNERAADGRHLGRIEWKGFPGEYEYVYNNGFPDYYDAVAYHPSGASLEKLFQAHRYKDYEIGPNNQQPKTPEVDRNRAREIIRYRSGDDKGVPGEGPRYRNTWRRDGATYVKFPSPENPHPKARYFGANDVMEHDHSVDHPDTSGIIEVLVRSAMDDGMSFENAIEQAGEEWAKLRPYITMWSSDTILRGKIWPTEGPPYTQTEGDWRHIDILKRVNINVIGADGPHNLPNEDGKLKQKWRTKRDHERTRLYYMLVAALKFGNTSTKDPEGDACQFIASLADMVDRDQDETYYQAPDGKAWALGIEKFPVINEVVFFSNKDANTPNYALYRFRIELYNPAENIPWIPDEDEAYSIDEYFIRISGHEYSIKELTRYTTKPGQVHPSSDRKIGADGMYGYPEDPSPDKKSWSRYWHLGWESDWPPGLTKEEMEAGIKVELWKPLKGDALAVPLAAGKVETIAGVKCVCVDYTPNMKLVKTYTAGKGPGGSQNTYLGCYRRWDPLNARIYKYTGDRGSAADKKDRSNLIHCPGWNLANYATLGRPNVDYPKEASGYPPKGGGRGKSPYKYERRFERNVKIVDGDLPSIGWLGELFIWSPAKKKPLTWTSVKAQPPIFYGEWTKYQFLSQLDTKGKLDLYRPFFNQPKYQPTGFQINSKNLHVLDIFTVWDPSNDGIDNDGDGAIDDEDTGRQPGDRGGAEVRVFGKLDANLIPQAVMYMVWPDGVKLREANRVGRPLSYLTGSGRSGLRKNYYVGPWGPFETIGDFLRADRISPFPGSMLCGATWYGGWPSAETGFTEYGLVEDDRYWYVNQDDPTFGDDDGDGITDERDERDMVFAWISNYYTTRANVFECDLSIQLSDRPMYPEYDGKRRKLPFQAYRVEDRHVRTTKQLLAILDRSTCLRINENRTCDFSGPVEARMVRFTDDLRAH